MSKRITIEPVPGRKVRDPATGVVVAGQRRVPDNDWWRRRLRDGDVQVAQKRSRSRQPAQNQADGGEA